MGRYVTWHEVRGHLDPKTNESGSDSRGLAIVEKGIEFAEEKFDNALRERYEVPFTEAVSPNAYDLAQKICSRWAAAWYLINARQSETEDVRATWYADRLLAAGDEIFKVFEEGKPPEDTPASDDGFSELIQDGYGRLSTTAQADSKAIFKRSHLPGRSDPW